MNFEVNFEIDDSDLEAAADFYQKLVDQNLPQHSAERIAKDMFGVVLNDYLLNRVLGWYATSLLTIEECVRLAIQDCTMSRLAMSHLYACSMGPHLPSS